jgi:hypothetical protein
LVAIPFYGLSQDVDDARFWYRWSRWRRWDVLMATAFAVLIFVYVGGINDLQGIVAMLAGLLPR